ncbi:MAG: T9SS type A sorting domain-containing protein [Chitinispirillaceae bacterium]|nr:T9SS type A sorting domain-containing protein [Chitinispirillaceae bacterium]
MAKKLSLLAIVIGAAVAVNAEVLFYTDFCTTPEEFAAASAAATAKDDYDTLLQLLAGESEPTFSVVDGCTLSVTPSSSSDRYILLSKASQGCVKYGDTIGCTKGRLSLKNSGSAITLPEVTGPCTITYYGASSSSTDLARGFQCVINGESTPDAGISELKFGPDDTAQATIKKTYGCTIEGPVVFKLIAQGSVYLYDIKIESGAAATIVRSHKARNTISLLTKDNMIINSGRASVEFFTLAGKKVMASDLQVIPLAGLSKGMYLVRILGVNQEVTSVTLSR